MLSEADAQLRREQALALLALTLVPGMGNRRISQFAAVLAGHGLEIALLVRGGNGAFHGKVPGLAVQFDGVLEQVESETLAQAEACIHRAEAAGLSWMHILEGDYPRPLAAFLEGGAPPFLVLQGNKELLDRAASAVVGTRSPSRGGIRAARCASTTIVEAGMTVVSGGAAGVDWAAHDGALRSGGSTVIFLPQGILAYEMSSGWQKAMADGRLLLASEYLPDAPWRTYAAVSRNALIAAQARLVCVIEPRKQGGSILTARHAVDQGKQVLVDPLSALPAPLQSCAAPLEQLAQALEKVKGVQFPPEHPGQARLF